MNPISIFNAGSKDNQILVGRFEAFVRNQQNKDTVAELRTVTVGGEQREVLDFRGGIKVSEFIQKQIKYFFGWEPAIDSYINFTVTFWGANAKRISNMKYPIADGDIVQYLVSNIKKDSYTSTKTNQEVFTLTAVGQFVDVVRRAKPKDGEAAPAPSANPAPPATTATAAAATAPSALGLDADFESMVGDDDDLPF